MIRPVKAEDRKLFVKLSEEFYHSEAVLHPVPVSVHERTFDEMMTSDRYIEGYILEFEGETAGYAVIAKTFSSEVGGMVIWIEEAYVLPGFQSKGLGREFFSFIHQKAEHSAKRLRLEVERSNDRAISLYERLGFSELDYKQMVKDWE